MKKNIIIGKYDGKTRLIDSIKYLLSLFITTSLIIFSSCTKESKEYSGEPQLAFGNNEYTFNITPQTTSISLPIQLISNTPSEATGTLSTLPETTCADAISYSSNFKTDTATYSYNLVVEVDYSMLDSTTNKLLLEIESEQYKVAKYYGIAEIILNKIK